MKHNIKTILIGLVLLFGIPVSGIAGGWYAPGTVVVSNGPSLSFITGQFSVRYNPAVSKGYITIYRSGTAIVISGTDSATGTVPFTCLATPTSPVYSKVEEAMRNAGNGMSIQAGRPSTNPSYYSSECVILNAQVDSRYLD